MELSKNLLSGMRRRKRTADGILFDAGDRARARGCLRHLPYLSEEYRFDQDGIGGSGCGRAGDNTAGLMGSRARVREAANQLVRDLINQLRRDPTTSCWGPSAADSPDRRFLSANVFGFSIGKCQSKHMVDRLNPQPS